MRLDDARLRLLFAQNQFPLPSDDERVVVVGLRGAVPVRSSTDWEGSARLALAAVDHTHPRCTIVLWDTEEGRVIALLGTTVPHRTYIERARRKGGVGANMNLTGLFRLVEGPHPWSGRTSHRALRQVGSRLQRRTADDLDYDGDDRVEWGNTANNLHAMWCQGPAHAYFASAGCSGPVGYPAAAGRKRATGDWAVLDRELLDPKAALEPSQKEYPYAILHGYDLMRADAAIEEGAPLGVRIRYGSVGDWAEAVQAALIEKGHLGGRPDGLFGPNSTRGLGKAQEALFGDRADDYICGENTAAALGLRAWGRVRP